MGLWTNAKVFFSTLCAAGTHTAVKKTFGNYTNAKNAQGNINLLGIYQDSNYIPKHGFIEDTSDFLDIDSLFEKPEPEKPKDKKEAIIEWFNSLDAESKQFIKDLAK